MKKIFNNLIFQIVFILLFIFVTIFFIRHNYLKEKAIEFKCDKICKNKNYNCGRMQRKSICMCVKNNGNVKFITMR